MRQVLGPGALGRPRGIGWRGMWEWGSGWGIHVDPWLIHVNVWQKPLQYCKVISLQLIKINEKKKKKEGLLNSAFLSNSAFSWVYLSIFFLAFHFSSQLFVKPQTTILPSCISFSWEWFWLLPPIQCYKLLPLALQALYPDVIPWIYSLPPLQHQSWVVWFCSNLNGLVAFSTFFNLSLSVVVRSSWAEPHSVPGLDFADCVELFHLWLQRV